MKWLTDVAGQRLTRTHPRAVWPPTIFCMVLLINQIWSVPIDNSLVGSEIITECLAGRAVDLAFILDGSGSIGDWTFDNQKNFVNMLVDRLDVGANSTRVGVVQYSETPTLELELDSFFAKNDLQGAIYRLQYQSGTTNTGAALRFAVEILFRKARGGKVPKVALILTDGQSQDGVAEAARILREAEVLMYAVGVTNLVNVNELYTITGSPRRVFTVEGFDQLDEPLSKLIMAEMCKTEFRPGYPEIICESDRIGVRATSKNPFEGHVFIKGHFHQEPCRRSAESFLFNPHQLDFTVPLTECDIRRYRSLNPRGVYVETTVIFMFHAFFMTKVDQAVKIQCFYMEAEKTVESPIEVSMIPTEFVDKTYPMPTCVYSIRLGSPEGEEVTYASVGESVFHVWKCIEHEPTYDIFGMVVHSCFVEDGLGNKVELVDDEGCGRDIHLLGTPDYDATLRMAMKEVHIFKYADKPLLQFQCQITICYKQDGGCDGITPPNCAADETSRKRLKRSDRTLDVLTDTVAVLDKNPASNLRNSKKRRNGSTSSQNETCISRWTLALIVGTVVLAYFLVAVTAGVHIHRRRKRRRRKVGGASGRKTMS